MIHKLATAAIVLTVAIQPSFAAERCLRDVEKKAFNARALQSELMIVALRCGRQVEYNIFVQRHQRELTDAYQQITSHFARIDGSDGQQERDQFITDLANIQSLDGMRQREFCSDGRTLVTESLHLRDAAEMSRFVAEKNVINIYTVPDCGTSQAFASGRSTLQTTQQLPQDGRKDAAADTSSAPNPALMRIQIQLENRGLYHGPVDGVLNDEMIAAMQSSLKHKQEQIPTADRRAGVLPPLRSPQPTTLPVPKTQTDSKIPERAIPKLPEHMIGQLQGT